MSLRDCKIKSEYRVLDENIARDFYIPLLSEATIYKRAAGFFTSSALIEISKGIATFVKNGGKIRLIASPILNEEDIKAINIGYENRHKIIEEALIRELSTYESHNYFEKERLNLLANLISSGVLEFKIAFVNAENKTGIYHEKMGIIIDSLGNKVAFSGSNNATSQGMFHNYETVDTYWNWGSLEIAERADKKEKAFDRIWKGLDSNLEVLEFPNVKTEILERYKRKSPNLEIDKSEFLNDNIIPSEEEVLDSKVDIDFFNMRKKKKEWFPRIPENVNLFDYQREAIEEWKKQNYKGIFDMATGTGKTYTGLAAIATLSEALSDKLAVIIVCPYQHLVDQWVEDIEKFNMNPIIGYSASPQKDWKRRLDKAVRDQKLREEKRFFCFICTNATFKNAYVQNCIDKIKSPILLLVDEAHNFGAQSVSKLLNNRFNYRLALSATLERHGDREGTEKLYNFFGKKCIEYGLERAIEEKKLTPYYYFPVVVYLVEEELQEYKELSLEISRCLIVDSRGNCKLNKRGEILAIKRSRIVAGARNKLLRLREIIKSESYSKKSNILVYCGATNVIDEGADMSNIDGDDIRQIEAVTRILGNEFGMSVGRFTSQETAEERETIKRRFGIEKKLQALVAIKCLDEGVNIPGISTAFILASTTNPKEYIQRRGRVLRRAPGKEYAEIYDFITLPRDLEEAITLTKEQLSKEKSLVKNEVKRLEEFSKMARNSMFAEKLIEEIKEVYRIEDNKIGDESYE